MAGSFRSRSETERKISDFFLNYDSQTIIRSNDQSRFVTTRRVMERWYVSSSLTVTLLHLFAGVVHSTTSSHVEYRATWHSGTK